MFFSVIFENVIFDPSSCNELGITQARNTKIYNFLTANTNTLCIIISYELETTVLSRKLFIINLWYGSNNGTNQGVELKRREKRTDN